MSLEYFKKISFFGGPLLALFLVLVVDSAELSGSAVVVAAAALWMAIWWASEAVHVSVTAFLPLILFPLAGVSDIAATAGSYSHPIIYLFFGGFIISIAVQKCGLHQRVALGIFEFAGVNARAIVGAFMVAAAVISMWISNTSTTMMLLPIATSVVYVIRETMDDLSDKALSNFELAMYLGLAYGATMGGIATLVGTPPNAFMAGFMESTYGIEVDFVRWMIIGVPLTLIMLPLVWWSLVRFIFPINFSASDQTVEYLAAQKKELGPWSTAEIRTMIIFIALVLGWLLRKPLTELTGVAQLTDSSVALMAAVAAFVIPNGKDGQALIAWKDTKQLPWGVLILFGGGLALAGGMTTSGLTAWLGGSLSPLGTLHIALLVVASCAMVIFLTELTSNLATTATFLPVMAALAIETNTDPLIFVVPIALAASFAFMLPVATPPNAIVFSTGRVPIQTMMRAGFIFNIVGIALLALVATFLVPLVF